MGHYPLSDEAHAAMMVSAREGVVWVCVHEEGWAHYEHLFVQHFLGARTSPLGARITLKMLSNGCAHVESAHVEIGNFGNRSFGWLGPGGVCSGGCIAVYILEDRAEVAVVVAVGCSGGECSGGCIACFCNAEVEMALLHCCALQDQAEIAVVEMMLEAYQMQMEKIHNKTLDNAILDAQSMVHIRLNVHRNRLTNVDLWITAFNTALIIGASVSGESKDPKLESAPQPPDVSLKTMSVHEDRCTGSVQLKKHQAWPSSLEHLSGKCEDGMVPFRSMYWQRAVC
eukprot:1158019-Pelagomonas_calceolata.AAC.1